MGGDSAEPWSERSTRIEAMERLPSGNHGSLKQFVLFRRVMNGRSEEERQHGRVLAAKYLEDVAGSQLRRASPCRRFGDPACLYGNGG
jgi:hypothetical protein